MFEQIADNSTAADIASNASVEAQMDGAADVFDIAASSITDISFAPGGTITGSIDGIAESVRRSTKGTSESQSNQASGARSCMRYLADAADDHWPNVTAQMIDDFAQGNWTDPKTREQPSRTRGSKSRRLHSAKAVIRAAVASGRIVPSSEIRGILADRRRNDPDSQPQTVQAAISGWLPGKWFAGRTAEATAVLPDVCELVAKSDPPDVATALERMRYCTGIAVWALDLLGTTDAEVMLDPRNVCIWATEACADQTLGWKSAAVHTLKGIGEAVCPEQWPWMPRTIGSRPVSMPYSPIEEEAYRVAAALNVAKDRRERMWLVAATLGAGLTGVEAAAARRADIVEIGDGRLAVDTAGRRPRRVPIRREYTELAREAMSLCKRGRFIAGAAGQRNHYIASKLSVGALGRLSLRRARATFVAAHLVAGTPLAALRTIAGPITGDTLTKLLAHCTDRLDADEAVRQGLQP